MVEDDELLVCSVCQSPFDIEGEGGISGVFGICPVAFCVWCYTSMVDMVMQGCYRCQEDDESPTTIN
tara:strand:+ start:400 stop:600 length:201 start_codon:yes stop_codon:yes gene_type:complete